MQRSSSLVFIDFDLEGALIELLILFKLNVQGLRCSGPSSIILFCVNDHGPLWSFDPGIFNGEIAQGELGP